MMYNLAIADSEFVLFLYTYVSMCLLMYGQHSFLFKLFRIDISSDVLPVPCILVPYQLPVATKL